MSAEPDFKFKENNYVRISAQKSKFHRFYSDTQVNEIFIVVNRYKIANKSLYQIKDNEGNLIKSWLYEALFHGYKKPVWVYNSQMTRIVPKKS